MSYSIIFQTKIVNLGDGRIIHFERSGCNNDTAGREKDVYDGKIYKVDDFIKKAKSFMENSSPYEQGGKFDLKIRSRFCSYYDYGKHLMRMLRNSESMEKFKQNNYFNATLYDGIKVIKPFERFYPNEDYPNIMYDIMYRRGDFEGISDDLRCMRVCKNYTNIDDCLNFIETNRPITFKIIKH